MSGCGTGTAKAFKVIGILQPGIVDGTFVYKELIFSKDNNHVIHTATHDFMPIVKAGYHHLVTQLDAFTTAGSRTLKRCGGCTSTFTVKRKMIARKKLQLIVHTLKT
uniref:Uncharacterized protein n=1 Tax=Myoviridae sp. ctxym25 TaxID=2825210 RepID=A0A8S5QJ75_9CAUD|nr:MAG TPA: hypothetical protein [Myoviridae sp. ctxym25]